MLQNIGESCRLAEDFPIKVCEFQRIASENTPPADWFFRKFRKDPLAATPAWTPWLTSYHTDSNADDSLKHQNLVLDHEDHDISRGNKQQVQQVQHMWFKFGNSYGESTTNDMSIFDSHSIS